MHERIDSVLDYDSEGFGRFGLLDYILKDNCDQNHRSLLFLPINGKEGGKKKRKNQLEKEKLKTLLTSFSLRSADDVKAFGKLLKVYVEMKYLNYILGYENVYIGIGNNAGVQHLFKASSSLRFSPWYSRNVEKRMNDISYAYKDSNALMITLTLNQALFGYDFFRMWEEIPHLVKKFIDAVRKYFKSRGLKMPDYLWVVEPHGSGVPHVHFVFFGIKRLKDKRYIEKNWWKYGFTYLRGTKDGKIRNPVSYITKYITKAVDSSDEKYFDVQALLWFFGIRSYHPSRGFVAPLKYSVPSSGNKVFFIVDVRNSNGFLEILLRFQSILQLSAG